MSIIRDKYHDNAGVMDCLLSNPASASHPPPVKGVAKKIDYKYLKPLILSIDCSKKELDKFGDECVI